MINKINLLCILIYFHLLVQYVPAIGNNNNTTENTKQILNNDNDRAIDNLFADDLEKYDYAEKLTEEEAETNYLKCTQKGYIRNPSDCSTFYRCVKQNENDEKLKIFQYSCPTGLIFDQNSETCSWPSLTAPCVGSGEIVKASKKRFVCPSYGYFQDKENCEYFYYCSNFGKAQGLQPYEFKCPFDLAFDEEKLLCNWKWLVKGCGVVNPDEPEMKRLSQLYEYKTDSFGPQTNTNSDKFLKRADFSDAVRSDTHTPNDGSKLARNYANQQEITKSLKQQMSELIRNIGQRIKSILWDNAKIQSRSDKPAMAWLSSLNPFSSKNSKQSQRTEQNRRASTTAGIRQHSRQSEQFISIPIISIRPDTDMTQFPNKNSVQQQFIDQLHYHTSPTKPSIVKQSRNRIYFPTKAVRDNTKASTQAFNSFGRIPDIIPVPVLTVNNKANIRYQNAQNFNKRPQHASKATRTPLYATTPKNSLKRVKNNFKATLESMPSFNLAPNQPLYLETVEQLEFPQSLKQQMTLQSITEQLNKEHNINKINKFVTHNQQNVFHILDEEIMLDNLKNDKNLNVKVSENRNKKPSKPINYNNQPALLQSDINPLHTESHITYEWSTEKAKPNLNVQQVRETEKKKKNNQLNNLFHQIEQITDSISPTKFSNLHSFRQTSSHQQSNKQTQQLPEEQSLKQHSFHVTSAQQQETTSTTKKPKSIIYWPNLGNFESVRTTQKQNTNTNLNQQKQEIRDKNKKSQYSHYQSNSYSNINEPIATISSNQFVPSNKLIKSSHNNERDYLDASATNHQKYESNNQYNSRQTQYRYAPSTKIRIISTTKKPSIYNNNNNESKKSQLVIIPVSDEYTKTQKYSNIERLTKDYPKLFPDGLSNTRVTEMSYQTVATTTPAPTPLPKDDYIMVMFNNEERLLSNKNGNPTKLHELIKNTDAKFYNLESENAQTIVALVPKQTENKSNQRKYNYHDSQYSTLSPNEPLVYESVKPQHYTTKSPVIIKLEIPQEKTDLLDNIVQKVKEGLSPTLSQFSMSAKTLNNYASQKFETTTNKPIRYTTTEQTDFSNQVPKQWSDTSSNQHILSAPIYDQLSSAENLKNQQLPQISPYLATDFKTYTPSTQDSAILEQIPFLNTFNLYNQSYPPLNYQLPWYHQIGYNPYYQPYYWPSYPQTPIQNQSTFSQYQNYALPSNYGYQQTHNTYQPPLVNSESTTHHWYNSYATQPTTTTTEQYNNYYNYDKENKQRVQEMFPSYSSVKPISNSPLTSTTTTTSTSTTTTTTTTTTTPAPTTQYYNYNVENYDKPFNSYRNSYITSQSAKIPTNRQKYHDKNNKNIYNEEADNDRNKEKLSEDKPQIQVYIVQGSNEPQLVQTKPVLNNNKGEKSDVKVIVVDSSKNVKHVENDKNVKNVGQNTLKENNPRKQYPNSDIVKLESSTQHNYNDYQQHVHKSQNINNAYNKYDTPPEMQFVESVNNFKIKDSLDNQYLENGNTDYESEADYEDESPLYSPQTEPAKHHYLPASKVQILQNLYNSTAFPELDNFTEGFVPETACARAGLFQHPNDCNKYYECFWDSYINRFTLHAFECPVKLAFDSRIVGCSAPNDPTICVQY